MDFRDEETAIIAELKSSVPYLKTVKTAEMDIINKLNKLNIKFPAALVFYSGSTFSLVDRTVQSEKPSWTIFVADKSLRGRKEARKGSAQHNEHGVYKVIVDVLDALTNQDFGLPDNFRLDPVSVEPVSITDRVAMYGIVFSHLFDKDYGLPA